MQELSLFESSVWPVATRRVMAPVLVPDHVLQKPWVVAPCSEDNRRELLEEGESITAACSTGAS